MKSADRKKFKEELKKIIIDRAWVNGIEESEQLHKAIEASLDDVFVQELEDLVLEYDLGTINITKKCDYCDDI